MSVKTLVSDQKEQTAWAVSLLEQENTSSERCRLKLLIASVHFPALSFNLARIHENPAKAESVWPLKADSSKQASVL